MFAASCREYPPFPTASAAPAVAPTPAVPIAGPLDPAAYPGLPNVLYPMAADPPLVVCCVAETEVLELAEADAALLPVPVPELLGDVRW